MVLVASTLFILLNFVCMLILFNQNFTATQFPGYYLFQKNEFKEIK